LLIVRWFAGALCCIVHQQTIAAPSETFLLTQDSTRKCLICGEVKPLTAEHFQAIRFFVKKFSFFLHCLWRRIKNKKDPPWRHLRLVLFMAPRWVLQVLPWGRRHLWPTRLSRVLFLKGSTCLRGFCS